MIKPSAKVKSTPGRHPPLPEEQPEAAKKKERGKIKMVADGGGARHIKESHVSQVLGRGS